MSFQIRDFEEFCIMFWLYCQQRMHSYFDLRLKNELDLLMLLSTILLLGILIYLLSISCWHHVIRFVIAVLLLLSNIILKELFCFTSSALIRHFAAPTSAIWRYHNLNLTKVFVQRCFFFFCGISYSIFNLFKKITTIYLLCYMCI